MSEMCTDRRALDPRMGHEGLLLLLRKILRRPRVQSVHVSLTAGIETSFVGEPGERLFPGQSDDAEFSGFYEAVRAAPVHALGVSHDPYNMLLQVFRALDTDGLVLRAILLGEDTRFWDWAGCSRRSTYLGYYVIYDPQLPSSCVSFLGAVDPLTHLTAVERTYVGYMEEPVSL